MTHNARILGDVAYVNGSPIPASYFQALDAAQTKAINGDAGGDWTPLSPFGVGGAGMWFCGPSTLSGGASVLNVPNSGARIVHNADDMVWSAGRPSWLDAPALHTAGRCPRRQSRVFAAHGLRSRARAVRWRERRHEGGGERQHPHRARLRRQDDRAAPRAPRSRVYELHVLHARVSGAQRRPIAAPGDARLPDFSGRPLRPDDGPASWTALSCARTAGGVLAADGHAPHVRGTRRGV